MGMKVNGTSGLTFPDTTTLASAGQASVRAWVNFNGTGTVAIRAAYNVTSITDNGEGLYTVNFTTAMPDANYAVVMCGRPTSNLIQAMYIPSTDLVATYGTGSFGVRAAVTNGPAANDPDIVSIAVFR